MSEDLDKIDWPVVIGQLSERFGDAFVPEVEAFLRRVKTERVLVACSGGPDSILLLLLLAGRADVLGLELVVAHYNHRWRGEASDEDAAFVAAIAKVLDLPYVVGVRPENEAAFTETTARALRLDFLREAAAEHRCHCIALGHQMDDILETQLQRIARGSGTDGLAAPRPIARFDGLPPHVRPLLNLRSGDIRMALNAAEIPSKKDASNDDQSIARNALRGRVIPELIEALDRDPVAGAARARRLIEEDARALESVAREHLPDAYSAKSQLARGALKACPRAITRRALSAWLSHHQLLSSVSGPAMDVLLDAVYGQKKRHRMSVGSDYILFEGEQLLIERASDAEVVRGLESSSLEPGTSLMLATGAIMGLELIEVDEVLSAKILSGAIDQGAEAYIVPPKDSTFEVRSWQPGDRFHPIGAPGSKKLKDWFIDRYIPQRERKQLPVVSTSSGKIIWVPGFPPADTMKLSPATKLALRLTYRTRNPTSLA
ncbi:MAG: tRNA lysidine(34) synthetase TilS [Opitutaceae bacterium]